MKKIVKYVIEKFSKFIILFLDKLNSGRYFTDELVKNILVKKQTVKYDGIELEFYAPNRINYYRIKTFSTKEPETLEWISTFNSDREILLYFIFGNKVVCF